MMRYQLSQAELIEAVQHYLNDKVLKRPVTVKSVRPSDDSRQIGGLSHVLHVTVEDDLEQVPRIFGTPSATLAPPDRAEGKRMHWVKLTDREPVDEDFVLHDGWYCLMTWRPTEGYDVNGWQMPVVARWKTLPAIRHVRALYGLWRVNRHYTAMRATGLGMLDTGYDSWVLYGMWHGREGVASRRNYER